MANTLVPANTIDAKNELRTELLQTFPGDVYDTAELQEKFDVLGFSAPFVVVTRKSDNQIGSLQFNHNPRLYFGFVADKK